MSPLKISAPQISPEEAKRRVEAGALLIDIREAGEHARLHIPGAYHVALSRFEPGLLAGASGKTVIFHCRSGARTQSHAARLAAGAGATCKVYLLDGGIEAWRRAGLPVVADAKQPIELQRQVQIAAGGLALLGTLLGLLLSPWFLALPLAVGVGALVAGITGSCGLAKLLARAPWNRAAPAAPEAATARDTTASPS